jgi:hypothetical protein
MYRISHVSRIRVINELVTVQSPCIIKETSEWNERKEHVDMIISEFGIPFDKWILCFKMIYTAAAAAATTINQSTHSTRKDHLRKTYRVLVAKRDISPPRWHVRVLVAIKSKTSQLQHLLTHSIASLRLMSQFFANAAFKCFILALTESYWISHLILIPHI